MPPRGVRELRQRARCTLTRRARTSGIIYWVALGFKWLTITVLVVLFIHIFLDFLRKLQEKRKKSSLGVADKTDKREWRIEALDRLHRELEEELRAESGIPLTPEESARIKERIREEIGERIKVRFDELRTELYDEILREKKKDIKKAVAEGEIFYRFGVNVRAQHFLLAVSTFLLIITGLPLRFHDSAVWKFIIFLLGGIQNSTFLHRVAAAGLMIVCVWHMSWLFLTREGRREFWELLPKPKDVTDVIHNIRYFLRLTNEKAQVRPLQLHREV